MSSFDSLQHQMREFKTVNINNARYNPTVTVNKSLSLAGTTRGSEGHSLSFTSWGHPGSQRGLTTVHGHAGGRVLPGPDHPGLVM